MPVHVVGVPWDQSSLGRRGSRFAPEAIRREMLSLSPYDLARGAPLEWVQARELSLGEDRSDLRRTLGRTLDSLRTKEPQWPVFLVGGDQGVTHEAVRHLGKELDLGLVVLDGRLDMAAEGGEPNHGNWLRLLLEERFLPTEVLGIGRFATSPTAVAAAHRLDVDWVPAESIHREGKGSPRRRSGRLRDRPLYVSVDMSVFANPWVPGIPIAEPGGLSFPEVSALLTGWLRTGRVVALDVTEVNPTLDPTGTSVRTATHTLLSALAALPGPPVGPSRLKYPSPGTDRG